MKDNILFITPHPDDMALTSSGTAFILKENFNIIVVCMTKGQKYSPNLPADISMDKRAAIRENEELTANSMLNATTIFFDAMDGEVYADRASCEKMAQIICNYQPKAVFAPWPVDWHPDHRATSNIAQRAHLLAESDAAFYYYEESGSTNFHPDITVDITAVFADKMRMVSAHQTQPLQQRLNDWTHVRCRIRGAEVAVPYAESFKRYRPLIAGQSDFLLTELAKITAK